MQITKREARAVSCRDDKHEYYSLEVFSTCSEIASKYFRFSRFIAFKCLNQNWFILFISILISLLDHTRATLAIILNATAREWLMMVDFHRNRPKISREELWG